MYPLRVALLAATAVLGFVALAAAADKPAKAPMRQASLAGPGNNWSGFYVGALVGYGTADSTHCDDGTCATPGVAYPEPHMSGWLGGATLGYNFQVADWVLGIEGDWSWGSIDGSADSTPTFICNITGTNGCATDVKSVGTLRGRAGYAFGRFLPYLTAGAAFSRLHASIGTPVLSEGSTTKTDFVWGGGVEVALAEKWSAKLEYLRIERLGDFEYDTVHACGPSPSCSVSVGAINLVRFGVNYRFYGGP
jgi:outer membrane immunogenic protein